jgi:hypothetical protein
MENKIIINLWDNLSFKDAEFEGEAHLMPTQVIRMLLNALARSAAIRKAEVNFENQEKNKQKRLITDELALVNAELSVLNQDKLNAQTEHIKLTEQDRALIKSDEKLKAFDKKAAGSLRGKMLSFQKREKALTEKIAKLNKEK